MSLRTKGNLTYADRQEDIRAALKQISAVEKFPATHFADAVCACGGTCFQLLISDSDRTAVRECAECGSAHTIGEGADCSSDTILEECECACGRDALEITAGVGLTPGGENVAWLYLGARCPACGLTACYGDWRKETGNPDIFLTLV